MQPSQLRTGTAAIAAAVLLLLAPHGAQADLVTFSFDPGSLLVDLGTTHVDVAFRAAQEDGADAAFLNTGFRAGGIVQSVDITFSDQVSPENTAMPAGDSFKLDFMGDLFSSASGKSSSTFGTDVDVLIGTLSLTLDGTAGLGATGLVSLLDPANVLGAPALELDGITAIPSNIGATLGITVVPEPTTAWLLGLGVAAFGLRRSSS